MMKYLLHIGLVLSSFFMLTSCEKDSKNGNNGTKEFIVAFDEQSISYSEIKDSKELKIVFSEPALSDGSVELRLTPTKAIYDVDFSTVPSAKESIVTVPFIKGAKDVSFLFKNLIYPYDRTDKTVQFDIVKVNYSAKEAKVRGYNVMVVSFDTAIGGVLTPEIGGPSQPKQVYVDLGGKAMYAVQRDSWDLAFYSDKDFRVKLNGSIYMATGSISSIDIDKVKESDVSDLKQKVQIGTFEASNVAYIDYPSGFIESTAINEIKLNDFDNKVYLVNLGFKPGSNNVSPGSVSVAGETRGWKKIRVLRKENGYLLQYANLNDTTHKEVYIEKNPVYNFAFFSFDNNSIVDVEPTKKKWDLNFTVFTNTVDQQGDPKGSYGFSDFIVNNRYGGVTAYKVTIPAKDKTMYKSFALADVDQSLLSLDLRTIGGTWRDVANDKKLFNNIFYVIKDAKGNFYKMRVLSFMNDKGERGYPKFEYSLLR
ncbi:HmuY family protein [Myroides sp. M-43]|uniref:HmuY family protein n=1 Tax=Myroides oncorhynchi TaxID=2893756 RepID=UPI001E2C9978|nr:HmuY family protein [Myroides oncorhynchi]MCC9041587.1 HmuY family protein [Myroides oncorhynchi]